MRKLFLSVALATVTLAAVPAAAQNHGQHQGRNHGNWDQRGDRHGGWNRHGPSRQAVGQLIRELDQVEHRIQRSARRGIISQREAFGLRREANHVRNRLHRAGRDGLSGREFAQLRVQVNRLEQRVRLERRDRDGRRG
ncbi:MAG TPA: hypothetical protein VN231_01590 [Allosphingosinicella sp.]|nr:hypothetical protein [Allosphingosinicella sp.]